MVIMNRVWAMPNSRTFEIPPIRDLIHRYLHGVSIDPFARNSLLATYTNDLNPYTRAQTHRRAWLFLQNLSELGIRADTVLFDPPYSPMQISECYRYARLTVNKTSTQNTALYKRCRDILVDLCKPNAFMLSFGWNSAGMGKTRGFELLEILLVAHGGVHNDTICTVERKRVT